MSAYARFRYMICFRNGMEKLKRGIGFADPEGMRFEHRYGIIN